MRKFFREVILRQRVSHNVVLKTDDELTRYVKQNRIIRRRRTFEQQMELEALAKKTGMNTREIRMQHYVTMQNLDHDFYDKGYINDNVLDYDFLHKRDHYKPLG